MIRLLAPRCAHRSNPASFRVLMCRAHSVGCGRSWLATTADQVVEKRTARDAHEGLCPGSSTMAPQLIHPVG